MVGLFGSQILSIEQKQGDLRCADEMVRHVSLVPKFICGFKRKLQCGFFLMGLGHGEKAEDKLSLLYIRKERILQRQLDNQKTQGRFTFGDIKSVYEAIA